MAKILIVYDSRTGNTEKMAQAVKQGASEAGTNVRLKKVTEASLSDLEWAEGIVLGSPDYFGCMSARMKEFIDKSIGLYTKGKLKGKVGAAFASSAGSGTGAETTALSLITAMVGHEMVIVSAPGRAPGWPGTYGVIADNLAAIEQPDETMLANCKRLGEAVADVAEKLA
jgi:NAD(P)H dehydrogenase (quinone)